MTEDDLLKAGYKYYPPHQYDKHVGLLQKCVKDEGCKHYYITVEKWDWREFKLTGQMQKSQPDFTFSPSVQFRIESNGDRVNVAYLSGNQTTVDDMEKFYQDIYSKMKFAPYEKLW